MRISKPVLSGKGLLAASIALLSGQALAETAGRVSFVSGEVTASSAGGGARALQRGDVISGGDKISTRAGRIQIRFSDGGFVSLQPNTVFGVDEYLYSNRKPEETSLFFSLLQGGMRTITGAIGKVNKQSYKVRTPVATIGIRGTEYLATVGANGLLVSVGAGLVYVENGVGNTTGGAGQNIFVPTEGSLPALSTEKAVLQASSTNGDQALEALAQTNDQDTALADTVAIGNVQNASGNYIFLQANPFPNGPGYSAAYSYNQSGANVLAGYAADGDSLDAVFDAGGSLQSASLAGSTHFDRKAAIDGGNTTVGSLKWGSWSTTQTNGTPIVLGGSSYLLQPAEHAHYIIGFMTPRDAFLNFVPGSQATYTYQGGSAATGNDGSTGNVRAGSTLTAFFGSTTSLSANINIDMKTGNSYLLTGFTTAGVNVSAGGVTGMPTFAMNSMGCSGAISGCSATLSGFFAGPQAEQIGLAYQVTDFDTSRKVNGTAAFVRGGITSGGGL